MRNLKKFNEDFESIDQVDQVDPVDQIISDKGELFYLRRKNGDITIGEKVGDYWLTLGSDGEYSEDEIHELFDILGEVPEYIESNQVPEGL